MKTVDFIFVGKAKNKSFAALEAEYHEKIRHTMGKSQIEIIKDAPTTITQAERRKKEARTLAGMLTPSDLLVMCDESGTSFDSLVFARKLRGYYELGQRVVFAIGGAYGTDKSELPANTVYLRLSDFTLPHELARIVLLEQVYRALNIWAGTAYHHE